MAVNLSPDISVIIPCKGHAAELRDCLKGLSQMDVDVPYEIIVVDSASDPDVLAMSKEFDGVKVVRSDENLSPGPARNFGVTQAGGYFLAFIDADCIPSMGWLQVANQGLGEGAQMLGGPVIDAKPDSPISVIDNLLQFADLSSGRPEGQVVVLPACNLVVRREAFDSVHGFPDTLLNQDSLFTEKLASRWPEKCWFVPEMVVAHKGRNTPQDMYNHHKGFGYFRGLFRFRITDIEQKIAQYGVFIPIIVLKRLIYIYRRILQWNHAQFFRYFLLLPIAVYGLWGWAVGFHQGCRDALKDSDKI